MRAAPLRTDRARCAGVAVLLSAAALSACAGGAVARRGAPGGGGQVAAQIARPEAASTALPAQTAERLLVRHASLALDVERPSEVPPRATALATALGGYVQSASEVAGGGVHLTLRVPAPSLDAAIDSLARLGRVRSRTLRADDVTEQAVDLEARLATLRGARDRLRELQGKAATVADLLAAERELTRVQGELDGLEARLKFLRNSVALAELTLDARRPVVLGPLGVVFVGLGRLVAKLFVLR